MDHIKSQEYTLNNRVGFHYYPDSLHYSDVDVQRWLPILKYSPANWLVIQSPIERAIPEGFIQAFASEGFNLIIDFHLNAGAKFHMKEIEPILRVYGKWGAKYALLNHSPNKKINWSSRDWANPDLVENFCGQFIEFANISQECGMRPIFSPLFPGGDYWDLAFLKNCAIHINQVASDRLINNLTFSSFGWDFKKPLEWGAGGPSAWPQAKAYHDDLEIQNQLGFRGYEWYSAIVESVFSKKFPFILFEINRPCGEDVTIADEFEVDNHTQEMVIRLLGRETVFDRLNMEKILSHIPDEVICGNLYLLTSTNPSDLAFQWYSSLGDALTPAQFFNLRKNKQDISLDSDLKTNHSSPQDERGFKYKRYMLISDDLRHQMPDLLEKIYPYLIRHQPKVGFDFSDAAQAALIEYVGPHGTLSQEQSSILRGNGSFVRHINPEEIQHLLDE